MWGGWSGDDDDDDDDDDDEEEWEGRAEVRVGSTFLITKAPPLELETT